MGALAFRLSVILPLAALAVCAQTPSRTVCIMQNDEGYDALRLARQLVSRKLDNGSFLRVATITGKTLPPDEERLATQGDPFTRVILADNNRKAERTETERLGCDYDVEVWYHESVDIGGDVPSTVPDSMPAGPSPIGDRTVVGYELRDAKTDKMLARASAPPRTVYVRQGRRVFESISAVRKPDHQDAEPRDQRSNER